MFKLTNLRELTIEEQLNLEGGTSPISCNCNIKCQCTKDAPQTDTNDTSKAVGSKVKKDLEK